MRSAPARQAQGRKQRGAVLVLVLWILTLLTFLLGAFSNEIRVENRIVGDMVARIRLRAGATAVLDYLAQAGNVAPEALGPFEGVPLTLVLGNSSVDYRLLPEEAFVSLNAAPPELLRVLIGNFPGGVDDVDALVDALVDWRDGDDIVTGSGAEAAQYASAGFAHGPRNAPLQSVDELGQVLGFTPELVDWLRPYVSVASTSPGVDPHFADPGLLLLLDPEGKLNEKDLAEMQADPSAAESMTLENPFFSTMRSGAYRVLVEGSGAMGLKRRQAIEVIASFGGALAMPPPGMQAQVLASGPTASPYRIIQWNEFPPLAVDDVP